MTDKRDDIEVTSHSSACLLKCDSVLHDLEYLSSVHICFIFYRLLCTSDMWLLNFSIVFLALSFDYSFAERSSFKEFQGRVGTLLAGKLIILVTFLISIIVQSVYSDTT